MGHQVEVAIWDQVVMALGGQVSIKKLKQTKKEIRGKKNMHETIATKVAGIRQILKTMETKRWTWICGRCLSVHDVRTGPHAWTRDHAWSLLGSRPCMEAS